MLTKIEKLGGVFRQGGKPRDPLAILKAHGCNCFRLRLFVNPNHKNAVVNDLPYTLALAKRIKAPGAKLLLNFHYSGTWADPGHQTKPAAWADLDFDGLEKRVETYTASVVAQFARHRARPDIVQIGNEIAPGMLWPDGKLTRGPDAEKQWVRLARLLKAGVRGVNKPLTRTDRVRIMIHIHTGGNWAGTKWFFDNLKRRSVPFDLIGLSYYPWWHGSLADLRKTLHQAARTYRKDIVVVETAYPYRNIRSLQGNKNMAWPLSPEGQLAFLADVVKTVRRTPDRRGIGVVYWYPESIPVKGCRIWNGGATALFDSQGNALPALKAFAPLRGGDQ